MVRVDDAVRDVAREEAQDVLREFKESMAFCVESSNSDFKSFRDCLDKRAL